ncbi:MAG TPA: cobalt ECF transporter T component CbiQ [Tepidisphaeraceae bacterium]|nr:cobalt ECF transporter T component CbiQ [Tepidisphaeraceae bacterium]
MHPPLLYQPAPARINATIKVMGALAMVFFVVALPARHAIFLLPVAAILLISAIIGRVRLRFILGRLLIAEPFILGVALLSLFQPGGWRVMLLIIARCTLCVATMIVLAGTCTISELVRVLKSVRIPSLLITTMLLMHRYLFVLGEEAHRMRRARASRTFRISRRFEWQNLATVIGQLFIRSADRADRIYAAMCARGWR